MNAAATLEKNHPVGWRSRRGQISHPLNWVLVLVAGAFFLLLFIAIIRSVTNTADKRDAINNVRDLERLIASSQANPNMINTYSTPEFTTECSDGLFSAVVEESIVSFPGQAIFSPALIDDGVFLWSKSFRLPEEIMTFTYLLPENALLLLVDMPGEGSTVLGALPDELEYKRISSNDLADTSLRGYDTVIVVTESPPSSSSSSSDGGALVDKKVNRRSGQTVLGVEVLPDDSVAGSVRFYTYGPGTGFAVDATEQYVYEPILLAAIFTADKNRYTCGLETVEQRLHIIARLGENRTTTLKEANAQSASTASNPACDALYDEAIVQYRALHSLTLSDSSPSNLNAMNNLRTIRNNLYRLNSDSNHVSLGHYSCPLLY